MYNNIFIKNFQTPHDLNSKWLNAYNKLYSKHNGFIQIFDISDHYSIKIEFVNGLPIHDFLLSYHKNTNYDDETFLDFMYHLNCIEIQILQILNIIIDQSKYATNKYFMYTDIAINNFIYDKSSCQIFLIDIDSFKFVDQSSFIQIYTRIPYITSVINQWRMNQLCFNKLNWNQ